MHFHGKIEIKFLKVWKWKIFPTTQILREISSGENRTYENAVLKSCEDLNAFTLISRKIWVAEKSFYFHTVFLHFLLVKFSVLNTL